MYKVVGKLKLVKQQLHRLNKADFHDISRLVLNAKEELDAVQHRLQEDFLNIELAQTEKHLIRNYEDLRAKVERFSTKIANPVAKGG